jgi:glycosyltransferase involved in cell wall biosynthesis
VEGERLRVIRKENGGLSSARNAGLAAARGRYVLPLDADDLIAPTFVEKTLRVLEADQRRSYCTSLVRFFVDDPERQTGGFVPWGNESDVLLVQNVAGPCTALFRRERIEEADGYDEWMTAFEDWDLYCRLAERGGLGEVIPEFLFFYRIRAGSMARSLTPQGRLALHSRMIEKHPKLLSARAQRLLLWEVERAREELAQPRHVWADRFNDSVKEIPFFHRLLKRLAP